MGATAGPGQAAALLCPVCPVCPASLGSRCPFTLTPRRSGRPAGRPCLCREGQVPPGVCPSGRPGRSRAPRGGRGPGRRPVGPRSPHGPALGLLSLHPAFGVGESPMSLDPCGASEHRGAQGNGQFVASERQAGQLDPQRPGSGSRFAVKDRGWGAAGAHVRHGGKAA